ncbi:MAG TPA: patatin-like phospholipase family protein, partial [Thermoanaerobaculia bacterium]|nr:patatin-like phospholipase family protein [Thermoanaerobaculia bacterium]
MVCAGGGVTGAIYEIGALAALEERLEDVSLADFDVFVGVSAGAYISALIANGIAPGVLYRNVTRAAGARTDIDDLALFRINLPEIAGRLVKAPLTILDAAWDYYKNRHETTLTDLVQSLATLLPSGVFLNDGLDEWMATWLDHPSRTNDFRKLGKTLRIVAVDLDTGETRAFGAPGCDAVPISRAVAASCALPGLYKPVRIDGVDYIDGGVRKTAH